LLGLQNVQRVFEEFGARGADSFEGVRPTETADAAHPKNPPSKAPSDGDDGIGMRALCAIALLCNQNELEVSSVLAQIARTLAPAALQSKGSVCRIDFMGASYWSPGYVEPRTKRHRSLKIGAAQVGSITLGYASGLPSAHSTVPSEELLDTAAQLVSQMLARRLDRQQLEEQRSELQRQQTYLAQTWRLARLGGWDFNITTSTLTWSDEAREIAALEIDGEGAPEREDLVTAFLRVAIDQAIRTRAPISQELSFVQQNGRRRWLHATGEVEFSGADPVQALGIIKDVTEEKEAQIRLFKMANHDALTGLPNRRHFLEKLDAALLTRGATGALVMIDLDNFKDINDKDGHDVGDALLRAFARRLEETAGKTAFVARLGGDEFAVLLPDGHRPRAERRTRSLLSKLREPLYVSGRPVSVRLSAGLTLFPEDGRGATELLKNADLAVYAAKSGGRNLLIPYKMEIRQASERRVAICSEVQEALGTDQFVPFYQPKICLTTGRMVGLEALLRWRHPSGIRTPGAILPAFDVPELSRALCNTMLDGIVSDMAGWEERGIPFGRVAFNASSAEFHGFDLGSSVMRRLNMTGLQPSCLGLEVTETVFLGNDSGAIVSVLKELHDAGVEIALDDFGTGFASLTHLQTYPVDVIKIDQSFIRGLLTDSGSQAITSVVLGLGRSLGMKVVAEGVETLEQARLLKAAGCDQVQGYFFARPMPASEIPGFVSTWRGLGALDDVTRHAA
jgi:diguanylate cyclase (GGDEF)-like protein